MTHLDADRTDHVVLPAEEARQGIMLGHVRYVLAISTGLSVLAGIVLLIVMV